MSRVRYHNARAFFRIPIVTNLTLCSPVPKTNTVFITLFSQRIERDRIFRAIQNYFLSPRKRKREISLESRSSVWLLRDKVSTSKIILPHRMVYTYKGDVSLDAGLFSSAGSREHAQFSRWTPGHSVTFSKCIALVYFGQLLILIENNYCFF